MSINHSKVHITLSPFITYGYKLFTKFIVTIDTTFGYLFIKKIAFIDFHIHKLNKYYIYNAINHYYI